VNESSAYDLGRKGPKTAEERLQNEINRLWERLAKAEDEISKLKAAQDHRWNYGSKGKADD
jgi:hypothetical protein